MPCRGGVLVRASRGLLSGNQRGCEGAGSLAVGGRAPVVRGSDILTQVQMARGIATCMDDAGLDPFTRQEV
jgi:hypothetical protein